MRIARIKTFFVGNKLVKFVLLVQHLVVGIEPLGESYKLEGF